ncbi:DUF551 domain-containing protein [Escherichia coli]|nr:DUF551 domain-containing protein [Escherichia coli]
MTTISRERIEQYANDPRMCNVNDEIRQIARIALASLEAEPVKRVNSDQMHRVCLEANRYLDKYDAMAKEVNKLLGRIAPPAPVLPHEWKLSNAQAFIERYSPPSVEEAALFAWNSCRAAMLHGAEPVSQTYKLNELAGNYPVTPDGWISCSERMPDSNCLYLCWGTYFEGDEPDYIPAYFFVHKTNGWTEWQPVEDDCNPREVIITHWMPLPAAPKQEVK